MPEEPTKTFIEPGNESRAAVSPLLPLLGQCATGIGGSWAAIHAAERGQDVHEHLLVGHGLTADQFGQMPFASPGALSPE